MPQPLQTDHHRANYQAFDYGPGVRATGPFAFISGQVGFIDDKIGFDIEPDAQIKAAFANLARMIRDAGAEPTDVVDLRTFHVGMQQTMEAVGREKRNLFGDWQPAWTAIGVSELALPGLVLEVSAVVCVPPSA